MVVGVGSCSPEEVDTVRTAFYEFLSQPQTSFGVYTPGLRLKVNCIVAGEFQVSGLWIQPARLAAGTPFDQMHTVACFAD